MGSKHNDSEYLHWSASTLFGESTVVSFSIHAPTHLTKKDRVHKGFSLGSPAVFSIGDPKLSAPALRWVWLFQASISGFKP
jgi:hypothetical protein